VGSEVKHGRRRAGGCIDQSIWPFQFGSPRDIEQAKAKTTKDQAIQKRLEAAFIEPVQSKPVRRCPRAKSGLNQIYSTPLLSRTSRDIKHLSAMRRPCE
jgi:hypothetical protein